MAFWESKQLSEMSDRNGSRFAMVVGYVACISWKMLKLLRWNSLASNAVILIKSDDVAYMKIERNS